MKTANLSRAEYQAEFDKHSALCRVAERQARIAILATLELNPANESTTLYATGIPCRGYNDVNWLTVAWSQLVADGRIVKTGRFSAGGGHIYRVAASKVTDAATVRRWDRSADHITGRIGGVRFESRADRSLSIFGIVTDAEREIIRSHCRSEFGK